MSSKLQTKRAYQSSGDVGRAPSEGSDRAYLNDIIFGSFSGGQSLLDIGSNLGFFCREAARRGGHATGIDPDADVIEGARELAQGQIPPPEYICGDFEDYDFGEQKFDVVIALNVLHHMFDAVHVLRRIQTMARGRVVLEVAQPTWRDIKLVLRNPGLLLARLMPVIWVDRARRLRTVGSRTFLFTRSALTVLFNEHTTAFEPLRFHRSPFKGRLIAEARKRDIGHLVVVAGPTSSGKSTFQQRFLADPAFRAQFVDDQDADWTAVTGYKVNELPTGRLERVLLHYDLLRPQTGSLKTHTRDPILDVLRVADRVTVITLVNQPERLVTQIEKGELARPNWRRRRRHEKLRDLYKTGSFLVGWYESWFRFCEGLVRARLILVENDGQFRERPAAEWRGIVNPQ